MRHVIAIGGGTLVTLLLFPQLPGRHLNGAALSLLTRIAIGFFLPLTAAVIQVLLRSVLGRTSRHGSSDPEKTLLWCVTAFVMTLHGLLIGALLDVVQASAGRFVLVAAGVALVVVGNVMPRLGPNLAFGIRTRRVLADRPLWMAVHRTAGYAVVALGLAVVVAGLILRGQMMPLVVCTTAAAGCVAAVQRYRRGAGA